LFFLGFKKTLGKDDYFIEDQTPQEKLLRLCNYLDDEKISYVLSQTCLKLLSNLKEIIRINQLIRDKAWDFKQGEYDKDEYRKFVEFVSSKIKRKLKDHQLKAAYHLYLVKNGANFSVPGSGKTSVVLTVYEKLKQEGLANVIYVVGPPACFEPWQTEFKLTLGRDP